MDSLRMNILSVDDMSAIRCLLSAIVQEDGHISYTAANGIEALKYLESIRFDLVFLDMKMPVMDGIKLLEKVKELDYMPNIVALTGFTEKHIVKKACELGARSCICKPFNVDDIRQVIRETHKTVLANRKLP